MEGFERAAGSSDGDASKAQNPAGDTLIHPDAFDLVQEHLGSLALNETGLEDDSLVRDGELGGTPGQEGRKKRDGGEDKNSEPDQS